MKLLLIDLSSLIFRAFYAIRPLNTPKGEPVNAVFGVATMVAKAIQDSGARHVAVLGDTPAPSFRKEIYPEYKANRSAPPDELIPQFQKIEDLLLAMKIPFFRHPGLEADDLIGSLALQWKTESPENEVLVVSSDKDLMQFVDGQVKLWDTMKDKVYGPEEVEEKLGVPPERVRDFLALVGDSSDNIPGVSGIGPKTAVELLKAFGSLDGVLEAAKNGQIAGKKCQTIAEQSGMAEISKRLATVETRWPAELPRPNLEYQFKYSPELEKYLADLDFRTVMEKWRQWGGEKSEGSAVSVTQVQRFQFHCVQSESDLQALIEKCTSRGEFGFDLETTGLNPFTAKIVGFSLAPDSRNGFYVPVGHCDGSRQLSPGFVLEKLRPILEDSKIKKVGQNLKFDWKILKRQGVNPDGIGADTMVAGYVISPEGRHDLKTLAGLYIDYRMMTFEEVCGKGKDQKTFDEIDIALATRYSAEDSVASMALWESLSAKLREEGLMQVFAEIDLPLVPILAKMELAGIRVDTGFLANVGREFEETLLDIQKKVHVYAPGINLNSPKQLAVLLFETLKLPAKQKTKTGYSTDADVLESLAHLHEVPRLLLEHREIAKLKGTYVDPFPTMIEPSTGRIHTSYHQTGTATGRLSSSDPNLQNIPIKTERGRKLRRSFCADGGKKFFSADYSQIELRILAELSKDADLVNSFMIGEDVHRRTASEIYGVGTSEVSTEQRNVAKAINFGLMYGKTSFGLSQELGISRAEAQRVIDRYFERYSGVKIFLDSKIAEAKETGVSRTYFGRRRILGEIHDRNPMRRAMAERMAMNTPVQGTAADLIKIAMIRLDQELAAGGFESKLLLQVHDELVIEGPPEEEAEVLKILTKSMEGAADFKVPLTVESASGVNWAEL